MNTDEKYSPYSYPPEWYDEVKQLNIYQRLHGAMADVQPLEKSEKTGIKFKFHGHEAVSSMVKGIAEKWRFVVESSAVDHRFEVTEIYGKPRMLCILTVRVRFVNIDRPDDFTETLAVGYGVDESDKGPGKALSYALKMACLKAFLIYDGEKLDMKEEGARLKREYGDPPTLEGIQIDCDEMEAEIAKEKERGKKPEKPEAQTKPAPADDGQQFGD
jgi:hypothetical protein